MLQVQHAGLRDSCTADILTVECLVRLVDLLFPDFNYTWLVEEIKNTTPKVPHVQHTAAYLGVHAAAQLVDSRADEDKQEEHILPLQASPLKRFQGSCRSWTSL